MRFLKIAAVCISAVCLAGTAPSAETEALLTGCFCSMKIESDRICGKVHKYDRETIIEIEPWGQELRTLNPKRFVLCREQTCPPNHIYSNGQCVAVGLPPPPQLQPETPTKDERFAIAGSNTIGEQLMPALIEAFGRSQGLVAYREACADKTSRLRKGAWTLSIACSAHGSGSGIPALAKGEADIAMLSRPINAEEQAMMHQVGYQDMDKVRHETVLALDGLVIVVAPQNPVRALSIDQIARIFAGEIGDWAQVGGTAGKINLYVRDEISGTRESFEAMVTRPHGTGIAGTAAKFESSSELSDKVAADPRGIGFVGFAYLRRARALPIAQPCGLAHAPSPLAIKTEDYPLSRRLYLYTAKQNSVYSADLVHYALSPEAQPVIESAGYVNQTIGSWSVVETHKRVSGYIAAPPKEPGLDHDAKLMGKLLDTAKGAERLSVSFRFRPDSTELDTKAWQDVLRLAAYVKTVPRNRKVLLLGFADSHGPFGHNRTLSQGRADAVLEGVRGVSADLSPDRIEPMGFSELMPVACNADEAGRAKNRRVEVWLTAR